jgi:signal transduction histidine kinase
LTQRSLPRPVEVLALAALYVALARIGQAVAIPPGNVTAVWLPSGLILAAVLLRGERVWPGVFLGAAVGNAWAYAGDASPWATGLAAVCNGAGDAIGALLAARLIRPRGEDQRLLQRPRGFAALAVYGAGLSSLISAVAGVGGLAAAGLVGTAAIAEAAGTWFVGDAVGVMVLTPLLLTWLGGAPPKPGRAALGESLAFLAAIGLATAYSTGWWPWPPRIHLPPMAVVPMLLWAVFRLGPRSVFTGVALAAAVAVTSIAWGDASNPDLVDTQLFVAAMSLVVGVLYAVVAAREGDREALVSLNAELEARVAERTAALEQELVSRERAETERRALERQVLHAQKQESLGVLAGGVAHDFNNILVAVLGHAELAIDAADLRSPVHEHLGEIQRAARRAAELSSQMLAYTGRGVVGTEPLDVARAVGEIGPMLRASVPSTAALRLELAQTATVNAVAAQLQQVVANLVLNAAEALPEGRGEIAVQTGTRAVSRAELAGADVGAGLPAGRYAFIEVRDDGAGLDEETRARMFEPFFTTRFTGRGLGLSAVLGIVRGHGGAILVRSSPGRGATFTVLLPTVDAGPTPVSPPRAHRPGHALAVLIVDDEPAVRHVARRHLERAGHRVAEAGDGVEALERIDRGERFDVALIDMTMPRMDGPDTARALRERAPSLRVILTTGYSVDEARRRLGDGAVDAVLQKPFDGAGLRAALARAMDA